LFGFLLSLFEEPAAVLGFEEFYFLLGRIGFVHSLGGSLLFSAVVLRTLARLQDYLLNPFFVETCHSRLFGHIVQSHLGVGLLRGNCRFFFFLGLFRLFRYRLLRPLGA